MIVGTAGHVDHGKTALVQALTGIDTDRLAEEKRRGISIDLGFAYMPVPGGEVIGFVDVPGHERFIRNMLAGATGIDFALILVAADDGIMPQTKEHIAILELLGIERGLVVLSKIDRVPDSRQAQVKADIFELLPNLEIVAVSAVTGAGVDDLRQRLFVEARKKRPPAQNSMNFTNFAFRMPVDRCFSMPGIGTIVTGTVLSGAVNVGDHVAISPSGLTARVRSIHAQNRPAKQGRAGERCALNLAGERITKDAIARGDMVLDPLLHAPSARIDARLRLLPTETEPVGAWMPTRFHHSSAERGARIVPLGDVPFVPGSEGWVQIVLDKPIAAAIGDRFILRDTSARRTIGGGKIVDLRGPARRRRTPERLAQLESAASTDPVEALAAMLDRPPFYLDMTSFARDRALASETGAALADRLRLVCLTTADATFAMSEAGWTSLRDDLTESLAVLHRDRRDAKGVSPQRLRSQGRLRVPVPVFAAVLHRLAEGGEIAIDGASVRLPSHRAQLSATDDALWARISLSLGGASRFRPPKLGEIAAQIGEPTAEIRRALNLGAGMGRFHEVAPELFFLRETLAEIVTIARNLASESEDGQFTAAQFRDRLDNGRKIAILLLEFLDQRGVTIRRGDLRRVNPQRHDLFGGNGGAGDGGESSPVGRPDFKSGGDRQPALGGFDPHSLPPTRRNVQ